MPRKVRAFVRCTVNGMPQQSKCERTRVKSIDKLFPEPSIRTCNHEERASQGAITTTHHSVLVEAFGIQDVIR